MPLFSAPEGVGDPLPTGNVRSALDEKFTLIGDALVDIQNAIPSVSGAGGGSANLTAVERFLLPDGILGVDSFFPTFGTDHESLIVNHRQDGGISSCVLGGLYHQTTTASETEFSSIIASDGTWPVVLAVKSTGYPSLSIKVLVEDTDNDYDLLIYRMDVVKSGSSWHVMNLRRYAEVILDQGSFAAAFDADVPISFTLAGGIGAGVGAREAGVIAPWNLEVVGAFLRLGTAPTETDGVEIEIRRGIGTDAESVLASAATWGIGESGDVVEGAANTPRTIVEAGEWLYPYVTVAEVAPVSADLSVTLLVRRVWHGVYR